MVPNDVWKITCELMNLSVSVERKSMNLTSWVVLAPKTARDIVPAMPGANKSNVFPTVTVKVSTTVLHYRQQENRIPLGPHSYLCLRRLGASDP